MKQFTLKYVDPNNDVDFLNTTSIQYDFDTVFGKPDSGWCDMFTGARILSSSDRIIFQIEDDEDESLLRFKFGDRIVSI